MEVMRMIKRFIDIFVPINVCNLQCKYCYVSQYDIKFNRKKDYKVKFNYSPEQVKKALTQERLGGCCHFNACGNGETLIPEKLIEYIRVILENGHSVMIVTNGVLTERIKQYTELPKELRSRLGFKMSFHYLELKEKNLLETFFNNVRIIREAGCSFSVELTANDDYEPYIDEIKEVCMKELGALCHVTIPRDEPEENIPLLSKHSLEEFNEIWKTFNSDMFDNKMKIWGEKRKEYCHAGLYSALLHLGTGDLRPCYNIRGMSQNIFENPEKPIVWCPVGKCKTAHCFNGHSFLAFGDIPSVDFCTYEKVRDRVDGDGNHWISEEMREHFKTKIYNNHPKLTAKDKFKYTFVKCGLLLKSVKNKIFKKNKNEQNK